MQNDVQIIDAWVITDFGCQRVGLIVGNPAISLNRPRYVEEPDQLLFAELYRC